MSERPISPGGARGQEQRADDEEDAAVVSAVLDQVGSWPAALVQTVAAVVLALESGVLLGVVLPGSTTLVVLGLWSAASDTHPALPIAVSAAASVGGALLGWRQGHQRRRVRAGHGRLRARVDPAVRRARGWLAAQGPGGSAVVLAAAHWAAVTRTLTPRVAGGAGVPLALVAPVLVLSGTAWAATVVLLSRTLGERVATDAGWVPAVAVAVLLAVLVVRSARSHRHRATGP
jgi:membrane-associated protein